MSEKETSNFTTVFSKMILSQAPKKINHKQRLEWLQERRQVGLWVQCNKPDCRKWRYLPHIHDPTVLPKVWFCYMNPDGRANACDKTEHKIKVHEEEDCIHGQYSAGSLVWAHLQGFPWWPAIVDDDPDTEQFYWLDGFSDIPTYYHVTFFDKKKITRAWVTPTNLQPFVDKGQSVNKIENIKIISSLEHRLKYATEQAEQAIPLTTLERLKKHSFVSTYGGPINRPRGEKILKNKRKKCSDTHSDSESDLSDSTVSNSPILKRQKKLKVVSSVAKMLETELSSTMVSLNELISFDEDYEREYNKETQVSSTITNESNEIPLQPKITIKNLIGMEMNCIIPETEILSSSMERTNCHDVGNINDAVVPSTELDVKNFTENSTQNSFTNSY